MANAMLDASRSISADNLSGRTSGGIDAELRLHWAAYTVGVMRNNANPANIGGMDSSNSDYDSNAWFFQTTHTAIMALQLDPLAPGRLKQLLKKIGEVFSNNAYAGKGKYFIYGAFCEKFTLNFKV